MTSDARDEVPGRTDEFRRAVDRATHWIVDYLEHSRRYPVLSRVKPGAVRNAFPASPPERPRSFDDIMDDFEATIVPGVTHWNHPSFFAYFSITGSPPGILGEYLAAALNVNGMLWRTSPAVTELETLSLDYIRQMIGIEGDWFGQILDTASTSTLVAMAAAREAIPGLDVRKKGLSGRPDAPALVVYTSSESHSSVDKDAIVLGVGTENVRRIGTDAGFRMDAAALEAAIRADIAAGRRPMCVVATVGTTSTAGVDPVARIADVCQRHGVWLHVDAAYAWAAAILPEKRWIMEGCGRADSIVLNPHKWLFTPIDASVLLCRHRAVLQNAFSLVPEYLRSGDEGEQPNLMDYGFQLGRRFRALKLWMVINYYGIEGLRELVRGHIEMARSFADWIDEHPSYERLAPTDFSLVCFRWIPPPHRARVGSAPSPEYGDPPGSGERIDRWNERLIEQINAGGEAFLSHTRVSGHFAIRCAIGNARTRPTHIEALKSLLLRTCEQLATRSDPDDARAD